MDADIIVFGCIIGAPPPFAQRLRWFAIHSVSALISRREGQALF